MVWITCHYHTNATGEGRESCGTKRMFETCWHPRAEDCNGKLAVNWCRISSIDSIIIPQWSEFPEIYCSWNYYCSSLMIIGYQWYTNAIILYSSNNNDAITDALKVPRVTIIHWGFRSIPLLTYIYYVYIYYVYTYYV